MSLQLVARRGGLLCPTQRCSAILITRFAEAAPIVRHTALHPPSYRQTHAARCVSTRAVDEPDQPDTNVMLENNSEPSTARRFYGCYLLSSQASKGRTYIGCVAAVSSAMYTLLINRFTVDPKRRIRQHNGLIGQGAWRTKRHRPWEMVLVVYGFPTQVLALQFEWAWQHPERSLAVRATAASLGRRKMQGLQGKVRR